MPRLFQMLLSSPLARRRDANPTQGAQFEDEDEDLALGWECANPALQFEGWDPTPSMPQESATAA